MKYIIFLIFQGGSHAGSLYNLTIWSDWKLQIPHWPEHPIPHPHCCHIIPLYNPIKPFLFYGQGTRSHKSLFTLTLPHMWTGVGLAAGLYVWVQHLQPHPVKASPQDICLNKVKGVNSRTLQPELVFIKGSVLRIIFDLQYWRDRYFTPHAPLSCTLLHFEDMETTKGRWELLRAAKRGTFIPDETSDPSSFLQLQNWGLHFHFSVLWQNATSLQWTSEVMFLPPISSLNHLKEPKTTPRSCYHHMLKLETSFLRQTG